MEQPLYRQGWRAALVVYASVQFLLLTFLAMLVYPGGAVFHGDSGHYLFLHNFFSDLGATVTPAGRSNLVSCFLFSFALASVGVALVLASRNWVVVYRHDRAARVAGLLSQLFVTFAGLGFVGVALTPWNLLLAAHNHCVQVAFTFLLLAQVCLVALQVANRWAVSLIALNAVYVLFLVTYVWILLHGPTLETEAGVAFQVVAQKAIVYLSVINVGLQASAMLQDLRQVPMTAPVPVPGLVVSAARVD